MRSQRPNRASIALALIAALALMIATVGAGGAAGASGEATASAKKGKCKKGLVKVKLKGKAKKKAVAKGKPAFKCRKPKQRVRATLTWDTEADLDLWAFDAKGNRGKAGANGIPKTSFSANVLGGPGLGRGPESFTDLRFVKGVARKLSYGVCFQDGGNNPTNFTLVYVTPKGVTKTVAGLLSGQGAFQSVPLGPAVPGDFCNA